jgi:hypothetical protein
MSELIIDVFSGKTKFELNHISKYPKIDDFAVSVLSLFSKLQWSKEHFLMHQNPSSSCDGVAERSQQFVLP